MEVQIIMTVLEVIHEKSQHPGGQNNTTESTFTTSVQDRIQYAMEYYSAIKRNTFESVLMRWMNLEPIIQVEVNQKEKDKFCILIHIYRIYKNDTEEFIYRATMEKQT